MKNEGEEVFFFNTLQAARKDALRLANIGLSVFINKD
jgi:hypothetical protein